MHILVYLVAFLASVVIVEAAIVRGPPEISDSGLPFKDCGSKLGKISSVEISGCKAFPCPLKRGTNVTVTMQFESEATISKAVTVVKGYIDGIPVPFPVPDDNACHFMNCPETKGTSYTYKMALEVKTIYPEVHVIVEWEVRNGTSDGTMITCFEVEAQIDPQ